MMRTMILSVMASCMLFASAQAQEERNILVNQQGSAYAITAPTGWLANKDVAQEMGLGAAFHLEGTVWETTGAFIFVNTSSLVGSGDNIYDLMSYDIDMYKISSPGIHIKDGGRLTVNRGKGSAVVMHMTNPKVNTYEAVAYIDQGDVVPFFVFSAASEAEFNKYLPAFNGLIESYKYYGPVTTVINTPRN